MAHAKNLQLNRAKRRKNRTLRLVLIAVFIALIAVGAFVKFPVGIVPVSMQCAMCVLCALMLGAKDATIAVAIYIAMGLVGIPIFTAGGGFSYVLQPTFGYLLGYLVAVPAGAIVARGVKNTSRPRLWRLLLGAFCALAILYTIGVMYMYLMLNFYIGKAMELSKAWLTGAAVFLPTDCMWCVVASIAAYKVVPLVFRKSEGMFNLRADLCNEEYEREI
ncbi:MAG: biotin transporter BioY [Bacteroides sp.]|nr:biotin transporter BioY [Bacillota bacterium]MCM1394235.1 biotin transporter BioY [[Eubacterium] siraeum]MCM1455994.1 biotin transporter BioY [Bacteroides sp.]